MLDDPNRSALSRPSDEEPADPKQADRQARSLLTPAKRAGLEALEREFADLLRKKRP